MKYALLTSVVLAMTVNAASADYVITIFQTSQSYLGGNPPSPTEFALDALGTGSPNARQTSSPFTAGEVTYGFGGGLPIAGEYAGNAGGLFESPFSSGNSTRDYLVAGGSGGAVTASWSSPQTTLRILWGTVDDDPGRNVIAIGSTLIDGAAIHQAILDQGFTWFGDGLDDTYLTITGLPSFTDAVFSDASSPAFEFALGSSTREVPGPIVGGGIPGLIAACLGLWAFCRRRFWLREA